MLNRSLVLLDGQRHSGAVGIQQLSPPPGSWGLRREIGVGSGKPGQLFAHEKSAKLGAVAVRKNLQVGGTALEVLPERVLALELAQEQEQGQEQEQAPALWAVVSEALAKGETAPNVSRMASGEAWALTLAEVDRALKERETAVLGEDTPAGR